MEQRAAGAANELAEQVIGLSRFIGLHHLAIDRLLLEHDNGRAPADHLRDRVKQMMRDQHKAMFIALRDGHYDEDAPEPTREVPVEPLDVDALEAAAARLASPVAAPAAPPQAPGRYQTTRSARPAAPSASSGSKPPESIFGSDLLSEKSLDEVRELQLQLERERQARWDLLSGALKQPIAHGAPADVAATLVSLCVEGDAGGVRGVFASVPGLDSFESAEAARRRCATRDLLPVHRALSGFEYHADRSKLLAALAAVLDAGADVAVADATGDGGLHKALAVLPPDVALDVVGLLLDAGADGGAPNSRGDSPRDFAAALQARTANRGTAPGGPYAAVVDALAAGRAPGS